MITVVSIVNKYIFKNEMKSRRKEITSKACPKGDFLPGCLPHSLLIYLLAAMFLRGLVYRALGDLDSYL